MNESRVCTRKRCQAVVARGCTKWYIRHAHGENEGHTRDGSEASLSG